jgi:transposase-like protein
MKRGAKRRETARFGGKQQAVARLLAGGQSIEAAAKESQVGTRTVFTWLTDGDYQCYVHTLRSRLTNQAVGRLAAIALAAVTTLEHLLTDEEAAIQLRAATAILDKLVAVGTHGDLAERLTRLEQASHERTRRR